MIRLDRHALGDMTHLDDDTQGSSWALPGTRRPPPLPFGSRCVPPRQRRKQVHQARLRGPVYGAARGEPDPRGASTPRCRHHSSLRLTGTKLIRTYIRAARLDRPALSWQHRQGQVHSADPRDRTRRPTTGWTHGWTKCHSLSDVNSPKGFLMATSSTH